MGNPKQPVSLLEYTGKSRLTKAEIEERRATEVHAPYTGDSSWRPKYLNRAQRAEFDKLSAALAEIGIYADVDAGELARYCVAHWQYEKYTKRLAASPKKKARLIREMAEQRILEAEYEDKTIDEPTLQMLDEELALELERDLLEMQAKCHRMCEDSAKALGLSVSSRCKLAIPKPASETKPNRFSSFVKSG